MVAANNKYALICQYDGTLYKGFQSQINEYTIQEKIENSLYKISNCKINIEYAGRTDSGVHATHQVIAFEIKWNHSKLKLENAINAYLPNDILVNNIKKVPSLFHPRKDAISRTYEYKISQAKVKNLFDRNYVYHYPYKLNISKIKSAIKVLEGRHDFKNFCKSENIFDNCIRDLYSVSVHRENEILIFKFKGSSFLRHQIRFMIGYILQIGRNKLDINELKLLLDGKNKVKSIIKHNVSPRGLCLTLVKYYGFSF